MNLQQLQRQVLCSPRPESTEQQSRAAENLFLKLNPAVFGGFIEFWVFKKLN